MVVVLMTHYGLVRKILLGGEAGGVAKLVVGVVLERAGHGVGGGVSILAVGSGDGELSGGRCGAEEVILTVHAAGPRGGSGLVGDEAHALAEGVGEGDGLGAAVEGLAELGGRLVVGPEVDAPVDASTAGVGVRAPLGESPLAVLRALDACAVGRGHLGNDAVGSHGRWASRERLGRDHEGEPCPVEVGVALRAKAAHRVPEGAGDVVVAQLAGADLDVASGN